MPLPHQQLKNIVEAILLAAGQPLPLEKLLTFFSDHEKPDKNSMLQILAELSQDYQDRGIELIEVASGFRIQVRASMSAWVSQLWEERPSRYSRALMETLAIIAYRQPITRGEIEELRGVSVSTSIIKTLLEREWVRIVGHREVPGRPSMFGTSRQFLDYFNLKNLDNLPSLSEIRSLEVIDHELSLAAISLPNPLEPEPNNSC